MYSHIVILFTLLCLSYQKELPSYIIPCSLSDPNLSSCIVANANKAIPQLVKGDRKYKIPVLDPIVIPKIDFSQGTALNVVYTDLVVHNIGQLTVQTANFNKEENTFDFTLHLDTMAMDGHYVFSGQILMLPIRGEGKANVTLVGGNYTYKVNLNTQDKNGVTHYNIQKTDLTIKLTRAHFYFANLFDGNEKLGNDMNKFIDENWEEILKELSPIGTGAIKTVFDNTVKALFAAVPKDKIFLP